MENGTSPSRASATPDVDSLLGALRDLLEAYAATLPAGRPLRTLPALLHAMPAIDALAAAGVARCEIAAVAHQTLAPLAAHRPGAAREVRVPVHRVYRAVTVANAASGSSPILRSRGLVAHTELGATAGGGDRHGSPGGEVRTRDIPAPSAMASATTALREEATPHARGTVTPAPGPPQRRHEEQGHRVEPPTQRVLGGIRQQSRDRRLPPRDEFDPYRLETVPPDRRAKPQEDETCRE